MADCALNDCHHRTQRDQGACKRRLRKERLAHLDQMEKLIREERIAILVDIALDVPMPASRVLRRG